MKIMSPSLWILLRLIYKAGLRKRARGLKNVRSAVLFSMGLLLFVLWLGPSAVMGVVGKPTDPDLVITAGPFFILMMCLLQLASAAGERAIFFTPAEVNFLFSGPFSRRELLVYKALHHVAGWAFGALFFSAFLLRHAQSWPASVVALFLAMAFIHFFGTAVMMVGETVSQHTRTPIRKVLAAVLTGLVLVAAAQSMAPANESEPMAMLESMRDSWALRYVILPIEPFARAFVSPFLSVRFALWSGIGAAEVAILFGFTMLLDANYLETAAGVSERLHAKIQRARKSGMAVSAAKTAKRSLPPFPWLWGAGPIAWRQALNASRNLAVLIRILVIMGCIAVPMFILRGHGEGGLIAGGTAVSVWLMIFLTMALRYDFRAEGSHMDVLKALPLSSWAVASGELLTPVAIASIMQIVLLGLLAALNGMPWVLVPVIAFAPPFNLILFGIENVLFLLFPSGAVAAPGDFQAMGRQMLTILTKLLVTAVTLGLSGGAGAVAYFLAGKSLLAAGCVAWIVLTLQALAVVPIVAWAYGQFDTGRDTLDE